MFSGQGQGKNKQMFVVNKILYSMYLMFLHSEVAAETLSSTMYISEGRIDSNNLFILKGNLCQSCYRPC